MRTNKPRILPELVCFRLIQAVMLVGIFQAAYEHQFYAAAFHTLWFWSIDWACQVTRRYHKYLRNRDK